MSTKPCLAFGRILFLTFVIVELATTIVSARGLGSRDGEIESIENFSGYEKRAGDCPPWKPFQCPEGICIPLKYLCDYNIDCPQSSYDENKKMCTAAVRPTVESTEEFLNHQLRVHGKDYFVKLFGTKAAGSLGGMGGVAAVSVALSESPRLNDFATSIGLKGAEVDHLRQVLKKVAEQDKSGLAAMGFTEAEIESLTPVVEQLVDTGFLKTE